MGEIPDSVDLNSELSIICSDIPLSSSPLGFLWNILPSSDQTGHLQTLTFSFSLLPPLPLPLRNLFLTSAPFRVQLESHLHEVLLPSTYQKGSIPPLFSHNRYWILSQLPICLFFPRVWNSYSCVHISS